MELLAVAVLITGLLCSNAESPPALAPADCNDAQMEKDAGIALDLINKHRRGGYILSLLRVADAYTQHLENASVVYLTLDVVDTECLVLSGKHWSSCGDRPFYRNTEFGQCKAVVYINQFSKQEKLYGYNCTMSPVPPQLYECKDCPVRIAVLEDAENYNEEAKKILQKYNQQSNETHYFKLEKIQKIFTAIGSRTAYVIEFTIKETNCLQTTVPTNVSECELLHSRDARVGFCRGKLIKDTKDPREVELNFCEIYDIPYGRHPFHHHHHHFHNDSGEHPHCNVSKHEYRPPGPSHRHHSPHHHHHHHHHHSPHHPHHHHHDFGHRHGHRHRHRHRCPPPSHHDHHGHTGTKDHHNSSEVSKEIPGLHPPPGPQLPPPPAGGPHHLPPSKYPSPPLGPPPPLPPCPPDSLCEHRPQPPHWFHKHGHRHHRDHKCNDTSGEQGGASSEEHDSFRHHHPFHHDTSDSIYYIPVLSQHDVLQAPGANFLNHPHSPHGSPKKPHVHGKHVHEKPIIQPFPDILSESKSCPGYPKFKPLPGLLPLYPPRSTQ